MFKAIIVNREQRFQSEYTWHSIQPLLLTYRQLVGVTSMHNTHDEREHKICIDRILGKGHMAK